LRKSFKQSIKSKFGSAEIMKSKSIEILKCSGGSRI